MSDENKTSPLTGIASGIIDFAGKGALQAFDYYNQKHLMHQQQNYNLQNMEQEFQYGQEMQRLNAINTAQSLKSAGISTALMTDGKFSSPANPAAQASLGHANAPSPTEVANLALLDSQRRKLDAESQHQEIINAREVDADNAFIQAALDNLAGTKAIFENRGWDTTAIDRSINNLEEVGGSLGTWVGNMRAIEASVASMEGFLKKLESAYNQEVTAYKLANGSSQEEAQKPTLERQLTERRIALERAQAYYMTQSGDEAKKNIERIGEEIQKFHAEIEHLRYANKLTDAQAKSLANQDVNTLVKEGHYGEAGRAILVGGASSAVNSAGASFGDAVGSAAGAVVTGGVSIPASLKNALKGIKPKNLSPKDYQTLAGGHKALSERFGTEKADALTRGYAADPNRGNQSFFKWLQSKGVIVKAPHQKFGKRK